MRLSDLQDIMNAPSRDVLWDIHQRSMARFGFGRLIYGFTRFRTDVALGDLSDMLMLSNFEDAYIQGFIDEGLYRYSPMLLWAV
ncbi:MAG: autoinducer binding domain-containing protein, partial [Pseudomonadota bacterium]